ncbi:hypothetical protein HVPorG_04258 [Roseomonas mucosa]|nr:hypothetical protein HVPorG_04258 [Roseomonas mucosa]
MGIKEMGHGAGSGRLPRPGTWPRLAGRPASRGARPARPGTDPLPDPFPGRHENAAMRP